MGPQRSEAGTDADAHDTDAHDTDVIVVGAGPVGLTIANILGQHGVRVMVIEALPSLIDYPRAVGIDDESLRAFQSIGVVESVLEHTTPNHFLRMINEHGRCFASIEPTTMAFGWPRRNAFIQHLADQALFDGLGRYPDVEVRFSSRLIRVDQDELGVTAVFEGEGGSTLSRRASYLVGADGGRSVVRKQMGVSWDGTSSSTRWLVVDVNDDPIGKPNAYLHADSVRPFVSIALPHNLRRFEFMLLAGEDEQVMTRPEEVDKLVDRIFPGLTPLDYIRARVYTHHARVAGSFFERRLAVAGDAAHLMPVWQGQGYNSGIRDAVNLGWKLAAVVQGRADPRLLGTYDSERRSHAAAMVEISNRAGMLIRQVSRPVSVMRNALTRSWDFIPPFRRYIVEMRYKPMPRYTEGAVLDPDVGAVGRMFPQPQVATRDGKTLLLDDVLGPWFTLLTWSTNLSVHLDDEAKRYWKDLGASFVVVRPMTQLHWDDPEADDATVVGDLSGALKSWFNDAEGSVVLLRPDRFVAAVVRPPHASEMTRRFARLLAAD